MAKARERGRGRAPRILINGHAAAYSSFRRIRKASLYHAYSLGQIRLCDQNDRKKQLFDDSYFAASCAHFASVLKNGFAGAGASTSPVSAAFEVTMCP